MARGILFRTTSQILPPEKCVSFVNASVNPSRRITTNQIWSMPLAIPQTRYVSPIYQAWLCVFLQRDQSCGAPAESS